MDCGGLERGNGMESGICGVLDLGSGFTLSLHTHKFCAVQIRPVSLHTLVHTT